MLGALRDSPPSYGTEPIVDGLLRQAAGPAVYARGAAYEADGRVDVVSADGSEACRVTLEARGGRAFGGVDDSEGEIGGVGPDGLAQAGLRKS